jgi:threonine dehydrogenase-like Zn-dependent dehydrogenase
LLSAGQAGDNPMLAPLLADYRRQHRRPARLLADKAYAHDRTRDLLRQARIPHTIPERSDQIARRHAKGSRGGRPPAFADLVRLPAANLVAVPDGVPDEHAVFVEPLAAACGVLERCPIEPGERVAIIGDGKLGLLCAQALAPLGPLVVGKHPAKLALARARGLETTSAEDARRRGRAFDVVIEASGGASGFDLALELLRPQGTLVLKSTFHGATPVDAARIVVDEIRVVGSRCGRFAPALDLLARGAVDVGPLISEIVSLDRAEDAMRRAAAPGVLKVLLAR